MRSFIIISDSHGRSEQLQTLSVRFGEADFVVHLGDGSSDIRDYALRHPERVFVCRGNCDFSFGKDEIVLEEEGVRIFFCHGHKYGVKGDLSRLAARAKELGCKVALYGHTHIADCEEVDGVLCINPGALCSYSEPSYCYFAVYDGRFTSAIVPLP